MIIGGPGGVRTLDLMTASSFTGIENKEDKELTSAKSGKVRQNTEPRRNPPLDGNPSTEGDGEKGGGA